MTRALLFLLVLAWLPACSTFREVPIKRMRREIDRGDLVRVTEHDEARTLFRVRAVEEGFIAGEDVRFGVAEIKTIEKQGNYALQGVGGVVELAIAVAMVVGALAAL